MILMDKRKRAMELVKKKLKEAFSPEIPLIQAISAIDEIDKNINIQYERLSELYKMYYPEAMKKVKDASHLVKLLQDPKRSAVSKKLGIKEESVGYEYGSADLEMIKVFAQKLGELIVLRKKLEEYVKKRVKEIAPKMSEVAGPMLAARLIMIAGSLKRLALMPSSTIQVLGAEKALFRHLRSGAKPPKHGVIIQHQSIQRVGRKERGKAARRLANEISKAARSDYFEKNK